MSDWHNIRNNYVWKCKDQIIINPGPSHLPFPLGGVCVCVCRGGGGGDDKIKLLLSILMVNPSEG